MVEFDENTNFQDTERAICSDEKENLKEAARGWLLLVTFRNRLYSSYVHFLLSE
jgi:hypothetical protein